MVLSSNVTNNCLEPTVEPDTNESQSELRPVTAATMPVVAAAGYPYTVSIPLVVCADEVVSSPSIADLPYTIPAAPSMLLLVLVKKQNAHLPAS